MFKLFLNIKKGYFDYNFWCLLASYLLGLRGLLKKDVIKKMVVEPKLLNMICRTHKNKNTGKAFYLKN